jgi:hypothetical protein
VLKKTNKNIKPKIVFLLHIKAFMKGNLKVKLLITVISLNRFTDLKNKLELPPVGHLVFIPIPGKKQLISF